MLLCFIVHVFLSKRVGSGGSCVILVALLICSEVVYENITVEQLSYSWGLATLVNIFFNN